MKIVEFDQQNFVITDNKEIFCPMPCHIQQNGLLTFKIVLSEREIEQISQAKKLTFRVATYNRAVQPIRVTAIEPKFPVTHQGFFACTPAGWDTKTGEALMEISLNQLQLSRLKKSRVLWMTVSTFGAPLQVFSFMERFNGLKLN